MTTSIGLSKQYNITTNVYCYLVLVLLCTEASLRAMLPNFHLLHAVLPHLNAYQVPSSSSYPILQSANRGSVPISPLLPCTMRICCKQPSECPKWLLAITAAMAASRPLPSASVRFSMSDLRLRARTWLVHPHPARVDMFSSNVSIDGICDCFACATCAFGDRVIHRAAEQHIPHFFRNTCTATEVGVPLKWNDRAHHSFCFCELAPLAEQHREAAGAGEGRGNIRISVFLCTAALTPVHMSRAHACWF